MAAWRLMDNAEIVALIQWAEEIVADADPTPDDGCRGCGYPQYDAVHTTLPHKHEYMDPRPVAMLAAIGRQLLTERDRARALGHELAGLAFHIPTDVKDRRIEEIDAELGFKRRSAKSG